MLYDVTQPVSEGMAVWPGDPAVLLAVVTATGEPSVSRFCMGSHTGTHVDPPAHFIADGATVDELPLDVLIGPAWLAHLPVTEPESSYRLTAAHLAEAGIPAGVRRVLLRTGNSARARGSAAFDRDFAGLAEDGARWLLAAGVRLVGIDGPSIEPFLSPGEPVHRLLLGAGVIVVEGLALAGLAPGPYQLYCLPLRIAGGDGGPARVILSTD